jgi:DNA-binding MarR family transcriptional regulator
VPPSIPSHEFLEPDEYESWNALLLLTRNVLAELDEAIRREHGIAVSEFDVLITLFNTEEQRMVMSELAARAMLSPAGTTHLVTRLERSGLLRREVDPADRRRWYAVLTTAGERALREARPTHNEVLRRTFLGATSPADRRAFRQLLKRLG